MSNQKKDDQMHIRCTSQQKEDAKKILKIIGQTSDFIIESFLSQYNNAAATLELQKYFMEREIADNEDKVTKLSAENERLKMRCQMIEDEISNKKLYDLSYYKNNEAITKAVHSAKTYVLQRNITNFNDIPETLFYEWGNNFKVRDVNLIMEISKNEFYKWQDELSANETKESANKKMQKIADRLNTDFKGQHRYTNWNDYIETRNDYIESKANADDDLNPVDLKLFLSRKSYDHKKRLKRIF